MAVKKKVQPKGKPKAARSAQAPQPSAPAAKRSKAWLVPIIMVGVLSLVAFQIYQRGRYLASLKFDMTRVGEIVGQGRDQGQAIALQSVVSDKAGQTFILEDDGAKPRIQRFNVRLTRETLVYKPGRIEESLVSPVDMDVDAQGAVYVLLKDGRVFILSNDLAFRSQFRSGMQGPTALSVNSRGHIYVASGAENKVAYFDAKGVRLGELGSAGELAAPWRMRVSADDQLLVIERIESGLRAKVFGAEHDLRRAFMIKEFVVCEATRLGLNGQGKAFFNDHLGTRGILAYDISNGKFFGESQTTKDGHKFISPGSIGASRYSPAVYVHTVVGLIKCQQSSEE